MRDVELIPPVQDVEETVEALAADLGLTVTLKGTLRAYPGCVHWHFKRQGPGTLEATWHQDSGRLWLKVAANRSAPWIEDVIVAFMERFGTR